MRISVIIPVFNASSTVSSAVESILSQNCPDVEIILVDDGSTDSSLQVCDSLASASSCVKVLHKPNGGVSSARNLGLESATGDYVMFLDSDDLLKPDSLRIMSGFDADMILAGFEKVIDGSVCERTVPSVSGVFRGVGEMNSFFDSVIGEKECFLLNSSCFKLYRRSLIADNGLRFDESLKYGEDKMFVFTFLQYASSAAAVPHVVYDYIVRDESLSSDLTSDGHVSQILLLLERYTVLLAKLRKRYADSSRLASLYHVDAVCRYVFRILTCFCMNRSVHMNVKTIETLYGYMAEDDRLSLFKVRPAQIPNVLLFKLGSPRFSAVFYSFVSRISRYISFR